MNLFKIFALIFSLNTTLVLASTQVSTMGLYHGELDSKMDFTTYESSDRINLDIKFQASEAVRLRYYWLDLKLKDYIKIFESDKLLNEVQLRSLFRSNNIVLVSAQNIDGLRHVEFKVKHLGRRKKALTERIITFVLEDKQILETSLVVREKKIVGMWEKFSQTENFSKELDGLNVCNGEQADSDTCRMTKMKHIQMALSQNDLRQEIAEGCDMEELEQGLI